MPNRIWFTMSAHQFSKQPFSIYFHSWVKITGKKQISVWYFWRFGNNIIILVIGKWKLFSVTEFPIAKGKSTLRIVFYAKINIVKLKSKQFCKIRTWRHPHWSTDLFLEKGATAIREMDRNWNLEQLNCTSCQKLNLINRERFYFKNSISYC